MAKMYGKFDRTKQNSKGWTKAARRHDEEHQGFKEAHEEMIDFPHHESGLCSDPKTGMAGCYLCYGDDYDGNGPEDLEGIEGVTFGQR